MRKLTHLPSFVLGVPLDAGPLLWKLIMWAVPPAVPGTGQSHRPDGVCELVLDTRPTLSTFDTGRAELVISAPQWRHCCRISS